LAAEQRRASQEMRQTLSEAMKEMDQMQSEWEKVVDTSAAELRELEANKDIAATRTGSELASLERARANLTVQTNELGELSRQRQTLGAAEEKMRKRYAALKQRYLQHRHMGMHHEASPFIPMNLPVDTEVAKAASKSLEAAKVASHAASKAASKAAEVMEAGVMAAGRQLFGVKAKLSPPLAKPSKPSKPVKPVKGNGKRLKTGLAAWSDKQVKDE